MTGSLRRDPDIPPPCRPSPHGDSLVDRCAGSGPPPFSPTVKEWGTPMRTSRQYRPRHRVQRRLTGVWMVVLAVLVTLVLSGPAGPTAPAYAATDQPTVSFQGSGSAPLACSSRPSVPNMTIKW